MICIYSPSHFSTVAIMGSGDCTRESNIYELVHDLDDGYRFRYIFDSNGGICGNVGILNTTSSKRGVQDVRRESELNSTEISVCGHQPSSVRIPV